MVLHVGQIRDLLGSRLADFYLPHRVGNQQVSCAGYVRCAEDGRECQSGEVVVLGGEHVSSEVLFHLAESVICRPVVAILFAPQPYEVLNRARMMELVSHYQVAVGQLAPKCDAWVVVNVLNRALGHVRGDHLATTLDAADTLQALAESLGTIVGNSVTIETAPPHAELLAFSAMQGKLDRLREEMILTRRGDQRYLDWVTREGYLTAMMSSSCPCRIPANPEFHTDERVIMRIVADGEVLGVIWVMDTLSNLEEHHLAMIQQASEAAAPFLLRRRESAHREAELRAALLDDVVQGRIRNPENVRILARNLGWNIDREQQAMVVSIDRFEELQLRHAARSGSQMQRERARLVELVRLQVIPIDPEAMIAPRSHGVTVLFASEHSDSAPRKAAAVQLAESIVRCVSSHLSNMSVTVGVSQGTSQFMEMEETLRQAELAARLGASVCGGNCCLHYSDLGIHRALIILQEHEETFMPLLQRIIDYDTTHKTDFVRTLEAYFSNTKRLSLAASQLNIHRNTLEYRLSRMEELTGVSLNDPNSRLALELGTRLLALKRDMQGAR